MSQYNPIQPALTIHTNVPRSMVDFSMNDTEILVIRDQFNHDQSSSLERHQELTDQLKKAIEEQKQCSRDLFNAKVRCDKCNGGPLDSSGVHANWTSGFYLQGMAEVQQAYERIEEVFKTSDYHYIRVNQKILDQANEMFRNLTRQYLAVHVEQIHQ